MKTILFLAALVIVLAISAAVLIPKRPRGQTRRNSENAATDTAELRKALGYHTESTTRSQYRDKFRLLNQGEQVLFFRLAEAVPALIVLSQVSLSQVFHINGRNVRTQLNEVGKKSLDYLICRKDFSIVAAIELNGPDHAKPAQQKSDAVKRAALEEAGIPLLIYTPDALPDVMTIRRDLAPAIVERKSYEAERNSRFQK